MFPAFTREVCGISTSGATLTLEWEAGGPTADHDASVLLGEDVIPDAGGIDQLWTASYVIN